MSEEVFSRNIWIQELGVYFSDLCKLLSHQRILYNDFLFNFLCDYQQQYDKNGIVFRDVNAMERYFGLRTTISISLDWALFKKYVLKNMSYISTFEMTKIFFWWLDNKGLEKCQWNILCLLCMPHTVRIYFLLRYIDFNDTEEKSNLFELLKKRNTLRGQIICSSLMNMIDCLFLRSSIENKKTIDKITVINPYENSDSFMNLNQYLSNLMSCGNYYNFMEKNWTYQNAIMLTKNDNHNKMLEFCVDDLPIMIDEMVNIIGFGKKRQLFMTQIIKRHINSSTFSFSYLHFILKHIHYTMFRFLFYNTQIK